MATKIDLTLNEDLSAENIEKAHACLENGGTKKAACEILGIKYNTKRLDTIIQTHFETKERTKRLRAKKRKEAISNEEKASIITELLAGASVAELAQQYYRSTAVINRIIDNAGARIRTPMTDYFNPVFLPEECVKLEFQPGEIVWAARYNCLAEVMAKVGEFTYRIWVSGDNEQQAYQDAGDLGSLDHLRALGVNLRPGFLPKDEVRMLIAEAFKNSKTVKLK